MTNDSKNETGIRSFRRWPVIPYLVFAPDCMIFCKINRKTVRHVKTILENCRNVLAIKRIKRKTVSLP